MRYPSTANFRDSPLFWLLLSAFSVGLHGAIAVLVFQKIVRIETIGTEAIGNTDWVEVEVLPLPTESLTPTPTPPPQAPAIAPPIPSSTPNPNPPPTPESPSSPNPRPTPTPPPPSPTPTPTPPSPTPTPTPPSPSPTSTTPTSLSVQLGALTLTRPDITVPDADGQAKPKQNQQRLENISYLIPPSVKLTERLVLDITVVIDNRGKVDEVLKATNPQNSLTEAQAIQLSSKILESWEFEPTYMGGQPVFQSYFLKLTIDPNF